MTLRELADRIKHEGGHPESYVSARRQDGSRTTIFGGELTADQWAALQAMIYPKPPPPVATNEQKARWAALKAADRH